MAWNNQGGPWGGGQSPWGRGGGGGGNQPPDFEEMIKRGQDRMKSILPGGFGSGRAITLIVAAAIVLWLITGFYVVNPGQIGVNIVFGRFVNETAPGLNWNWPTPIGAVETPDITTRFTTEIGYRSSEGGRSKTDVPEESLMLTKDENIIEYQAVVLWRINDVQKYLFQIDDPQASVKNAVEAAIREIIGQSEFQPLTTTLREQVAVKAAELAQKMLDSYNSGIVIEELATQDVGAPQEVIEAFRDVQRARNDANSAINDAQAYSNKLTEGAKGQAVQIEREAEAYKAQKVAVAEGDAKRFLSVYGEYKKNPNLTERRIYLETMGSILGQMDKILIDPSAGNGAVPYLPLDQLLKKTPRESTAPAGDDSQAPANSGASQ